MFIQDVFSRIYEHVATDKICSYCSINQQYVKGNQKQKKANLTLARKENLNRSKRTKTKWLNWILGDGQWDTPSSTKEVNLLPHYRCKDYAVLDGKSQSGLEIGIQNPDFFKEVPVV